MKEALSWVHDAISSKDIAPALSHYLVKDGFIFASDGRMTAAHPFPYKGTFCVSGPEFEAILKRMDSNPNIEVEKDKVTLKLGRLRGTIKTIDPAKWAYSVVKDKWLDVPKGLLDALRKLRPFISDNATRPFALCVQAKDNSLYTTNNVSLAKCEGVDLDGVSALIPFWAIDFIISRQLGLEAWAHGEGYLGFEWSNRAWMRTQLVSDEFPLTQSETLLRDIKNPTFAITPEWRAAFENAKALIEETLVLKANVMTGDNKNSSVEVEAITPMPKGSEHSIWTLRYLAPVIACATHFQPDAWPGPSPFKGVGITGIIAGRRS